MTFDWARAFPRTLVSSVDAVVSRLPDARLKPTDHLVNHTSSVRWPAPVIDRSELEIPYRIYNPSLSEHDPQPTEAIDRTLLACIYSRHHNGYVRQLAVRHLIDQSESFVAPFIVQLLGEYVLEIVDDIASWVDREIKHHDQAPPILVEFAKENPGFLALTRARAHSYWAEYHRRRFECGGYPASVVLARIGDHASRRSTS